MSKRFDVECTVSVSHTFESLHAYVELDGAVPLFPGDHVLVHGTPINPPYGETQVERRVATVTRAGWLERLFVRARGQVDFLEALDLARPERSHA